MNTLTKRAKSFVKRGGICSVPNERTFLYKHLENFAGRLNNKRILDIGAGIKQYQHLFSENNRYESCDMEDGFHPGVKHDIIASIYEIPVENKKYDAVLMLQVLEHLEFPIKGLKEIFRLLKDDGYLFLSVPQAAGDHFEPHHYFNYTQYGLKSVLGQAGFEIKEHYRLAGIFYYVSNRMNKL